MVEVLVVKDWVKSALAVTYLLVLTILAAWGQEPPAVVARDAAAEVFSAERAMEHVRVVAREPHPAGSEANARVREYIIQQLRARGLEPDLQPVPTAPQGAMNIVARLSGAGAAGRRAILVAAHYDSVRRAPGAGDDASGVAAMLEALRALRASDALANDVVFLFSDGEELGLYGVKAFVSSNPEASGIGVALNFEARGTSGPSLLFETSAGNAGVIEAYAKAVKHPRGTSLFYDVYRFLPNNTDFSIFKDVGMRGLNFAFIGGVRGYHAPIDTPEILDARSLQHHGDNMLALVRHFGAVDLDLWAEANAEDEIYFDFLGRWLVRFPKRAVLPALIVLLAATGLLWRTSVKQGLATARGTLLAAGLWVLLGGVSAVVGTGIGGASVLMAADRRHGLAGDFPGSGIVALTMMALTIAGAGWACARMLRLRALASRDVAMGSVIVWSAVSASCCLLLPGGSYLVLFPLAAGLALLALDGYAARGGPAAWLALRLAPLAVFPLVVVPALVHFVAAVTVGYGSMPATLLALSSGLVLPTVLVPLIQRERRTLAVASPTPAADAGF